MIFSYFMYISWSSSSLKCWDKVFDFVPTFQWWTWSWNALFPSTIFLAHLCTSWSLVSSNFECYLPTFRSLLTLIVDRHKFLCSSELDGRDHLSSRISLRVQWTNVITTHWSRGSPRCLRNVQECSSSQKISTERSRVFHLENASRSTTQTIRRLWTMGKFHSQVSCSTWKWHIVHFILPLCWTALQCVRKKDTAFQIRIFWKYSRPRGWISWRSTWKPWRRWSLIVKKRRILPLPLHW